ncbi:MAG: hypothetical protein L6437_14100 [Kiritimatiellae bacterium]|nr:hypothetical protein [Kiritimatiellia bacterium]
MSKPVRVAFVMEGPTDYVALRAAVRALLNGRDFEPTVIWPELNENLAVHTAGGWGGVYKWCRQAVEQAGGPARKNPIFAFHDVLVIQVDADVARSKYSDYMITDAPNNDLPCEKDCPPPSATTDALRAVMLGWLDEVSVPAGAVLCTPSKSIETWVLVALFPADASAKKANIECRSDGEVRLRKYGLIKSGQKLINKYLANEAGIRDAWPDVRGKCSEAERFSHEFLALVPAN